MLLEFIEENENWKDILQEEPFNLRFDEVGDLTLIKYNQLCSNFGSKLVQESRGCVINNKNLDTLRFINDPITKSLKFSLLKSIFGNNFIMVVGAAGTLNRQIKVDDGKKLLGNYKCIASFLGEDLPKNKILHNKSIFDLYVFNRKI